MKTYFYSNKKFLAILGLIMCASLRLVAQPDQNIVYPTNSGVVNMVTSYSLIANDSSPTSASFNTTQIQKAINENRDQLQQKTGILYFPNGTYYISNKLTLGSSSGVNGDGVSAKTVARYITFQGQSRTGTVLRLVDGSAGFDNPATGKPMLAYFEGNGSNALFRNYLRNITIDVGTNNPGAIGVDFHCNNHGGIFDVLIKSSDAQQRGLIGLKMNRNLTGIGLIKHLRVEGFDKGIVTGSFKISYVFEHVELDGQKVAGIENTEKPIQIRKLKTTNQAGPSVVNLTAPGHIVLLDSELGGTGDAAIVNQEGFLFLRNVVTTGYGNSLNDRGNRIAQPGIREYSSHGVYKLWDSTPSQSLNLPIEETPQVPWETDMSKWVVVEVGGNGDQDDAPTVQAAIDQCTVASGKNTVFIKIPGDKFVNMRSPIIIRGNVQRFLMPGTMFKILTPLLNETNALIKIETTDAEVLEIEGTHVAAANTTGRMTILQNNSTKTVVLRDVSTFTGQRFYQNAPNAGPLFIEISGHQKKDNNSDPTTIGWEITNQKVWARNFNLMEDMGTGLINDGGQLWILGYKFEADITETAIVHSMITKNKGFTEVLGGVDNEVYRKNANSAVIVNDNSRVSHISSERASNTLNRHTLVIREIRGEETREFKFGDLPKITGSINPATGTPFFVESSVIPLYAGYDSVLNQTPQTISFAALPEKQVGDADFDPAATASSGLAVSYTSSNTAVAIIVEGKIRIVGAGSSTITASQSGNILYKAAPPVDQVLTVTVPTIVKVKYLDGDYGQTNNNAIRPYLTIVNEGTTAIPYSELTARYWFTAENYAGINTWIDYAQVGNSSVKMKYVALDQPRNGAFGYIEYSFTAGAGNIASGGNSGPIQSRFANTNWSNLSETDDYSYKASTTYDYNDHITLYRNGKLVWGVEPTAASPVVKLTVYSENKNSTATGNTLNTYLKINNEGNVAVAYGDLSVRYWFTAEGTQGLNYWVDYAKLGSSNVTGQFVRNLSRTNADTYLAFTVNPSVGLLYPSSTTDNIQYRVAKADWSAFNEINDHSYKPAGAMAANDHITVYYKGQLVYGIEPATTGSARVASWAEDRPLTVTLLNNPLQTEHAEVEVRGALGDPLTLYMTDLQGRTFYEQTVKESQAVERQSIPLTGKPKGIYLLKVSTLQKTTTVKVIK